MMRALSLEFQKMKRLHTIPILGAMITGVVAMSCMTLFRTSFQTDAAAGIDVWPNHLSTYCLVVALLSPIVLAVIASRQVEIESSGQGWTLSATAGLAADVVFRAKLGALGFMIFVATLIQSLMITGLGVMVGITAPIPMQVIALYTLMLFGVNLVFLAAFLSLASRVENQLITLAAGLLSAFISTFGLLMPEEIATFIPWGYYAKIMPVAFSETGFTYIEPAYIAWSFFMVLGMLAVMIFNYRLNYIER